MSSADETRTYPHPAFDENTNKWVICRRYGDKEFKCKPAANEMEQILVMLENHRQDWTEFEIQQADNQARRLGCQSYIVMT